jgi:coenzyme F420-0:L-glutamate ligase / coenzyme F420-1:gamma-L-glutamate ligase
LRRIPEATGELRAIPLAMGEIKPGDLVPQKIFLALKSSRLRLLPGDILVLKHKIVSKAEGQVVALRDVKPSPSATRWAQAHFLDARVSHLALSQAKRIVRQRNGVLITETRHGWICANSGVDVSNVDGGTSAILLPHDADRSAAQIYRALKKKFGVAVPVIISDSFGRPWREGLTEVAIGLAGMRAFRDYRGQRDNFGYALRVSLEATADELACVAGLVCGKLTGVPACIIRGFHYSAGPGRARDLIRPAARDLFR